MEVGNPRFEEMIPPPDALNPGSLLAWVERRTGSGGVVHQCSAIPRIWRCGSPSLCFVAKLLFDKGNDILHGAQVVSRHIFIIYYDGETLLNEHY